jgi:hypothetical protein
MTASKDSVFSILSIFLMMAVAFLSLAFFIQNRDAGGFLAWVFLFAAFISTSGNGSEALKI